MTSRRKLALASGVALLAATPAWAESGLQIFPDLIDDLMYGTYGGALVAAPWTSVWVQLIALFVVFALVLNPILFKPLLRLLDARGERIEGRATAPARSPSRPTPCSAATRPRSAARAARPTGSAAAPSKRRARSSRA